MCKELRATYCFTVLLSCVRLSPSLTCHRQIYILKESGHTNIREFLVKHRSNNVKYNKVKTLKPRIRAILCQLLDLGKWYYSKCSKYIYLPEQIQVSLIICRCHCTYDKLWTLQITTVSCTVAVHMLLVYCTILRAEIILNVH